MVAALLRFFLGGGGIFSSSFSFFFFLCDLKVPTRWVEEVKKNKRKSPRCESFFFSFSSARFVVPPVVFVFGDRKKSQKCFFLRVSGWGWGVSTISSSTESSDAVAPTPAAAAVERFVFVFRFKKTWPFGTSVSGVCREQRRFSPFFFRFIVSLATSLPG